MFGSPMIDYCATPSPARQPEHLIHKGVTKLYRRGTEASGIGKFHTPADLARLRAIKATIAELAGEQFRASNAKLIARNLFTRPSHHLRQKGTSLTPHTTNFRR
jgi:hypothetical protein